MSRRATGLSDEIRNKMKDAEKTLEEHKSDQKAINAGNYVDPGITGKPDIVALEQKGADQPTHLGSLISAFVIAVRKINA